MAFDINWGMAQPVNALGMGMQGFQQGMQMGREMARENALSAYAANPDDPRAVAGLTKYEPRMAMQIRADTQKRQQEAQRMDLTRRAVTGDAAALTDLAGVDPDMWMKLDNRTKETVKQATGFMGQAVLDVSRLPEQDRAAAWGRYVQQAEANGMDIPAQYEAYSPAALNAVAAEAGTMEKLIKQYEPDWRFSPNGGLVDFNNPESIGQYGKWMQGQSLGAVPPPPSGFVVDGQGGPASAPAGFRP